MTRFTKSEASRIREDIEQALKDIEKKYNAKVSLGGIRYGAELGVRLTFAKMAENENGAYVHSRKAQTFMLKAEGMGLSSDVLGQKLPYQGQECIITGYNTRAKKYPIEYTKSGMGFKCSVQHMKSMIRPTRPEFFL